MADLKAAEISFKKAIEFFLCSPSPENKTKIDRAADWYADEWIATFTLEGDKDARDNALRKLDGIEEVPTGPKE